MVVEPYLHGLLPDIVFFPLSISYERTLEETLFAQELLGVPKPKESTSVSNPMCVRVCVCYTIARCQYILVILVVVLFLALSESHICIGINESTISLDY